MYPSYIYRAVMALLEWAGGWLAGCCCVVQGNSATQEKKTVMAFSGRNLFIRDSNAARCQLSIALGFVMWLQVLTEIAPCQVAIRAFLRTSGRVPRACP